MRFICGGFYLIFLSLISGFALGAPIQYETVRVGPASYAPSGVSAPITTKFSGPAIQTNQIPSYKQIVPVATKPVVGKLGRSLIRGGGVGLAVTAAVEGLGYLIDQATGEIKKVEKQILPSGSYVVAPVYDRGGSCTTSNSGQFDSCLAACNAQQFCFTEYRSIEGGGVRLISGGWSCTNPSYPYGLVAQDYRNRCYSDAPSETEQIVDLDPSDYEVIDVAIDDFSLSQKSRIISQVLQDTPISGVSDTSSYPTTVTSSDPQVQSLFDMWPQLQEALSQALNATLAQILQLTNPEFSPTPEEQELINRGIWAPPPETSVSVDLELPVFCQWAEFICRPFIDTEHPEVPELDLEAEDYDSGLPAAGQCPAPILIEFELWGEHEISLQPVCDFAAGVRPFLLAIAYLVSAFIVVGVRR